MHDHDILLAVHIPKTGGTTFKNILRQIYKDRFIRVRNKTGHNQSVSDEIKLAVKQQASKKHACVIYGHYYLDPFYAEYPRAKLVVWLRDPLQRVLSNYFFNLRSSGIDFHADDQKSKEESILKYISDEKRQNVMSKMIGNHKIEDFNYVGITEEYAKSLTLSRTVFRAKEIRAHNSRHTVRALNLLQPGRVHVMARKINPNQKSVRYEVSESLRQKILDVNATDVALYRAGKEHFDNLCQAWLPSSTR